MRVEVSVLRDCAHCALPDDDEFALWVNAALEGREGGYDLAIALVDEAQSQNLNQRYRNIDRPTNVLSFAQDIPTQVLSEMPIKPLGDLVLCAPLVIREAAEQGKAVSHHWAHLTVHGVLHLLGLDHVEQEQAVIMESKERAILLGLDIPDPYREQFDS